MELDVGKLEVGKLEVGKLEVGEPLAQLCLWQYFIYHLCDIIAPVVRCFRRQVNIGKAVNR